MNMKTTDFRLFIAFVNPFCDEIVLLRRTIIMACVYVYDDGDGNDCDGKQKRNCIMLNIPEKHSI